MCNRHMLLCKKKVKTRVAWGFIDVDAFLGKMELKSYRSHKTSVCVGSTEGNMWVYDLWNPERRPLMKLDFMPEYSEISLKILLMCLL